MMNRITRLYKQGLVLSILTTAVLAVVMVAVTLMATGFFLLTSLIDFPQPGSIPYYIQGVFYVGVSLFLLLGVCLLYGVVNVKLLEYIWSTHTPLSVSKTVGTGLLMCVLYSSYHSITLRLSIFTPLSLALLIVLILLLYPLVDGFVARQIVALG